jgi:hypothetical protein
MIKNDPTSTVAARDRMLAAFDRKMDKNVGHRGDMHIADFAVIDPNSGHLLIGYQPHLGPITSAAVTAFIARAFDGKVIPLMQTAVQHKAEGAVKVIVARTVPMRKIEDRKSMLAISATHFLDQALGDQWEVKSHSDGTKYLARVSNDNISAIVEERKIRMGAHMIAASVTFGNTLSAGVPNLNVGDTVRFYDSGQMLDGKIESVGAEIVIAADTGRYTVAPEAVAEIVQVSPQTTKDIQGYLGEYFADAYGFEDYAKDLTHELSR